MLVLQDQGRRLLSQTLLLLRAAELLRHLGSLPWTSFLSESASHKGDLLSVQHQHKSGTFVMTSRCVDGYRYCTYWSAVHAVPCSNSVGVLRPVAWCSCEVCTAVAPTCLIR